MVRAFNRIFDILTGFNLDARLKEVLEMDTWSREQIDAYQKERLEELKRYASRSIIYKDCQSWHLSDFPLFGKDFYRSAQDQFLTNFRKPYRIESTSGSTGTPRNITVSKEMMLAKRVSHLKMLRWYGQTRESKEVYIGGLSKDWKYRIYYLLKNKVFLSSYTITRDKALAYIQKINRVKPAVLFSYPYALDLILHFAEETKTAIHPPGLIYTGAENLYPHIEQKIRRFFPDSKLADEYWSTEANLAVRCPHGKMHVDEDTVILEVDNPDKDGTGDLLVTNLFSYDLPLIRYRLGDRIKFSDSFCSCGRKTRVIEKIMGRDIDCIDLPDGRKIAYTENSIQIAQMCSNIVSYQILYDRSNREITFCYVAEDKKKSIEKDRIRDYFNTHFDLKIGFKEVEFIESDPSGKYRIFKSVS